MIEYIGYFISGGTLFLGVLGVLLFWFVKRSRFRFKFILVGNDLKSWSIVKARIKASKDNKNQKFFSFKNNNAELEIDKPHIYLDNKPYRLITFDETGDYQYLKDPHIDEAKALIMMLKPQAKSLALYQFQDNQRRFPITDKLALAMIGGAVLMGIFIMVGFIYSFASLNKSMNILTDISKGNSQTANSISSSSSAISQATENLAYIYSLTYNVSVSRPVPPDPNFK